MRRIDTRPKDYSDMKKSRGTSDIRRRGERQLAVGAAGRGIRRAWARNEATHRFVESLANEMRILPASVAIRRVLAVVERRLALIRGTVIATADVAILGGRRGHSGHHDEARREASKELTHGESFRVRGLSLPS